MQSMTAFESRLQSLDFDYRSRALTLFQLGRDNFYHLKSISRDKAVLE